jgi:hypothetical protein
VNILFIGHVSKNWAAAELNVGSFAVFSFKFQKDASDFALKTELLKLKMLELPTRKPPRGVFDCHAAVAIKLPMKAVSVGTVGYRLNR